MLKTNKTQTNLTIIGSLLHKPPNWKPAIKLLPWMSKEKQGFIIDFYLKKVLKLLTTRNETLATQAKELFEPKKVELKAIIDLLNQKKILRELKTHHLTKTKKEAKATDTKERKFYTFSHKQDSKNITTYSIYDGQHKHYLKGAKALFDYLLEQKDQSIILMGWNVLNIPTLHPLLQEALTRGFYPTVKGGAKKRGGVKIVGCYLKGDSIIIKDVKKFYLEESKENEKLDKLYKTIQKVAKTTHNKYQVSLLDKNISTLTRVAWIDFWRSYEQDQKIYGWENVWDLNKIEDEFIRQSYQGGYLDLFNESKYQGLVSDWDFKKFFPSIMARHSFPISRPLWINHPQEFFGQNWKQDFYGFYECEIECLPENIYPFFTYQDEKTGSYIYRPGKYQTVLFSEEIKFYWNHTPHIKIAVKNGYTFQSKEYIFTKWIRKMYHSAIKGDSLAKIKMNSLYGMFGQEKTQVPLIWASKRSPETISEFKDKDKKKLYLNLNPQPKYYSHKFTNVAIASAITSYGRITLWHALLSNWDNLLYCSTDGFVLKGNQINHQLTCSHCQLDFNPLFGSCGELEKEGEYQGFISLAPHVYAFKDKKGKLIGKNSLKKEQFEFLFNEEITLENKQEIWNKAPQRQQWGLELNQMLNEIINKTKKKLVNDKWEIYK